MRVPWSSKLLLLHSSCRTGKQFARTTWPIICLDTLSKFNKFRIAFRGSVNFDWPQSRNRATTNKCCNIIILFTVVTIHLQIQSGQHISNIGFTRTIHYFKIVTLEPQNPAFNSRRWLRFVTVNTFQWLMFTFQLKLHSKQVKIKSFDCPNNSKCFFFGLTVSAFNIKQTSRCIGNYKLNTILTLGQNRTESSRRCIRNNSCLTDIPKISKYVWLSHQRLELIESILLLFPPNKVNVFSGQILNWSSNWCQIRYEFCRILHKTHERPSFTRGLWWFTTLKGSNFLLTGLNTRFSEILQVRSEIRNFSWHLARFFTKFWHRIRFRNKNEESCWSRLWHTGSVWRLATSAEEKVSHWAEVCGYWFFNTWCISENCCISISNPRPKNSEI